MQKYILSVIIPVYNVEQYVYECLLSVIEQNYDNIEIIIVDDGSTDTSFSLCKQIKEKYKNKHIKLIHQENKGLSVARNVGMEVASGEYIMFLDSDDMLMQNSISILVKYIEQYNADIYLYDSTMKNETNEEVNEMEFQRSHCVVSRLMSGVEYMSNWYVHTHIFSVCLCLFRKDYLKNKMFLFTEGKYHEDISFSFKTVLFSDKIIYIPKNLHIRRCRPGSITTSKSYHKNYDGIVTAFEECEQEYFKFSNKTKALSNAISYFWYYGLEFVIQMCKLWNEDKERAENLLNIFLEELWARDISYRGYTWFSILGKLLEIGQRESFKINDIFIDKIKKFTGNNIIEEIGKIKKELRSQLFKEYPLDNPSLTIGIYGVGNHSRVLLEEIQKYKKIQANIYFIDSNIVSGTQEFMDYKIINYRDISLDTDIVLISSFIHRGELLLNCYKMQEIINFKIIDPYEIEFYPIES